MDDRRLIAELVNEYAREAGELIFFTRRPALKVKAKVYRMQHVVITAKLETSVEQTAAMAS